MPPEIISGGFLIESVGANSRWLDFYLTCIQLFHIFKETL
jgi:hypothetical protein